MKPFDQHLPATGSRSVPSSVAVRTRKLVLPTYEVLPADKNPMFLEKRVYQGSSGKVYPLPFHDRVADEPNDRAWDAIDLENEFLLVTILPEIGGRIHVLRDKTNGYDLVYNQPVIKPALVGLAGPWISGGIEFNWPQHHRPATYMPCDVSIEHHVDGSVTVWLSDHEPMNRMKGMHGVCLHPGRAVMEVKARLYNRTPLTQSFLWWANVATRVHERYQSFFPPDVAFVADHAKRAVSRFPLCDDRYYGVDYRGRAEHGVPAAEIPAQFVPPVGEYAANDLSWYANIPVPTSYMCTATDADFFGGYDHAIGAGIVHVASHHISPGKKQWTWGNHEFGYAWDRNLTAAGPDGIHGPYIELMAGVYTDNQPDFSFLAPGETKVFSQYWYPIQKIGPAQAANVDVALSLKLVGSQVRVGVGVTRALPDLRVSLTRSGRLICEWKRDLSPAEPMVEEVPLPFAVDTTDLVLLVQDGKGELLRYQPRPAKHDNPPSPATEPPPPTEVRTIDELFIIGLHLEQYRHATRQPILYWQEALHRDPLDARCNNAVGLWHLRRGEFELAERHFRNAISRITSRNPNPADGEPFYNLGLTLRHLGRLDEAYAAFYKSTWNAGWRSPGYHAIAEIDAVRGDWMSALSHLDLSLRHGSDNLRARNLRAIALRKLDRHPEADLALRETLALDPLDWWARHLAGETISCSTQVRLDLALDFSAAGLCKEAIEILSAAVPEPASGTAPLVGYYLGFFHTKLNDEAAASKAFKSAKNAPTDYCFPARLQEIQILSSAIADPKDAKAPFYLGNLYYDRRRYDDAIAMWERAAALDPSQPQVWRNLGIAHFNVRGKPAKALAAYRSAVRCDPDDARLVYEQDQLMKRCGVAPRKRLKLLLKSEHLVQRRDDLTVECAALLNQTHQHTQALQLICRRNFQPWEGGEGLAIGQYVRSHLALGQIALRENDPSSARDHFIAALQLPASLGEARHLLANQSDVHYWIGVAAAACNDIDSARYHWEKAADFIGDFQEMSVQRFSPMTYYSALSLIQLGQRARAGKMGRGLLQYAQSLARSKATVDYFATSLPAMLLFDDDPQKRQNTLADILSAQAHLILNRRSAAVRLLRRICKSDPGHAIAFDLLGELEVPVPSPLARRNTRIVLRRKTK